MRALTKQELLGELRRLKAENERLSRLVQSQRPELQDLRALVTAIRDHAFSAETQTRYLGELCDKVLPADDDLPSTEEIGGIWSKGRDRVVFAMVAGEPAPEAKEST